jgi:MFS family permease
VKLGVLHRRFIYAAFAFVFLSGLSWMVLHYGVAASADPDGAWPNVAAWTLRMHGAGAMLALVAAGSLLSLHVPAAWRLRRNHVSGLSMLATLGALAVTGWLLYYAAGETSRAWSSYLHMAIGVGGPLALLWHLANRERVSLAQAGLHRPRPRSSFARPRRT